MDNDIVDIDIVTVFNTKLVEAYTLIEIEDYVGAYKILNSLSEIMSRKNDVQAMLKFTRSTLYDIETKHKPAHLNRKSFWERPINALKKFNDWAKQSEDPLEENQEEGEE